MHASYGSRRTLFVQALRLISPPAENADSRHRSVPSEDEESNEETTPSEC
ncbi:hypothetical protein OAG56_04205 [Mariniblastus sp.]|nr:hypothetical protein [Mariniblastus sp.]MDB4756553.1 hypothetical protein [Mariniblastus sp.]